MGNGEIKLCPVCDSPLDANARRCTECNTDLSLFDVDDVDIPDVGAGEDRKSIDDILASIVQGKDVRPELFDAIKTVATDGFDDLLSVPGGEPGVQFECPNCGTRVVASAEICPGCGARFAEGATEQFECPICGAIVDMDAQSCPNCGVGFSDGTESVAPAVPEPEPATPRPGGNVDVEDLDLDVPVAPRSPGSLTATDRLRSIVEARRTAEARPLDPNSLYKELPRLVNEVKPLLLTAKRIGVDIHRERELISEAITQGKKRDVDQAVRLIREARVALEQSFTNQVARWIEECLSEGERARASGGDVSTVLDLCNGAIDALAAGDYETAADRTQAAREVLEVGVGGGMKAAEELQAVKGLLTDVKTLGLQVPDGEKLMAQAEAALAEKSWEQVAGYSAQARQAILRKLPDVLSNEMRQARAALLDLKVRGGDLTKPVGMLKQASIHLKREEYADAVRFVRMFRDEVRTL